MSYQGGPVTNAGEAQAFLNHFSPEASAARIKAGQEAYAKSPEGMAKAKAKQDKQNTISKIYNEQGDEALADWYLSQDPKKITRQESNPAKNVKKSGGKYTFAMAAQEEKQNYDAAAASHASAGPMVPWTGSTFQFALDNPYNGGNDNVNKPSTENNSYNPSTKPSFSPSTKPSFSPSTKPSFSAPQAQKKVIPFEPPELNFNNMSKAKEKAQNFIKEKSGRFDDYSFNPYGTK